MYVNFLTKIGRLRFFCAAILMVFVANANASILLVANQGAGKIDKYDGSSGAFLGTFINGTNVGGLAFGWDGNLYAANQGAGKIDRYDGSSGAFLGTFIDGTNVGGLAFYPNTVPDPSTWYLMLLSLGFLVVFGRASSQRNMG